MYFQAPAVGSDVSRTPPRLVQELKLVRVGLLHSLQRIRRLRPRVPADLEDTGDAASDGQGSGPN
jgi:hypothetical protein